MSENVRKKTVLIACGASGGHVFPALAVAEQLKQRGFNCVFVGNKANRFVDMLEKEGYVTERLPAAQWNVRNPIKRMKAIMCLINAFFKGLGVIQKHKASAVFGTGGYATVALVLASKFAGTPTIIAEQNVLPGRANRFLAKWADKVCLTFEASRHYLKFREGVMVTCGNPIRAEIVEASKAVKEKTNDTFTLFIMGGSQGAKILSDVLPDAVDLLPYELKRKLKVIQQTRPEDEKRVIADYHRLDVDAEIKPFFNNMAEIMAQANLLVARSGVSTICEAALFGVPAIYVPLKLADGHQILNAKAMEGKGAALMIDQGDFTPAKLAEVLQDLMTDKVRLEQMAKSALETAEPEAAKKVADEVEKLSEQDVMQFVEDAS